MLEVGDIVGITFWIISVAMVAATAFFFLEANSVAKQWATSVRVAGLVTLIAAVHYYYMRAGWVDTGTSPTVYRYIDWLLTVPLQMIEFYLILAAVGAATSGMFWRLLVGTLVMLVAGFAGETGMIGSAAASNSEAQKSAFNTMKWIVSVGWCIYPIGYFMGYLTGGGTDAATLNGVYNIADFVNKIAFGLAIWAAAKSESKA